MLIQVYLHTFEEADNIKEYACESCKEVERRDYIPLDCYLKKGDNVNVYLNIYGKKLMMSEKKILCGMVLLQNADLTTIFKKILI